MFPSLTKSIRLIGRSQDHLWHRTLKPFPHKPIWRSVDSCLQGMFVWKKMIRWNVRDHHTDIFCSWYVVDIAELNNKSSHGAISRQRDMQLVPTQILFSSQNAKKMRPHVHNESTILNNRLNHHSPLFDKSRSMLLLSCSYWLGQMDRRLLSNLHFLSLPELFTCTL